MQQKTKPDFLYSSCIVERLKSADKDVVNN